MEANRYVSQRVKELRKARGLTQHALADMLRCNTTYNWTTQTVSIAERCEGTHIKRWSVDDLYALSDAFAVPVSYFLA